jgi:hypothetical protein
VREDRWVWSSTPSPWLAAATVAVVAFSLSAARFGVLMAPLRLAAIGAIIGSVILFTLLLDLLKRIINRIKPHS